MKKKDGYYICSGCGKQIKRGGVTWYPSQLKPTKGFHRSCYIKFEKTKNQ